MEVYVSWGAPDFLIFFVSVSILLYFLKGRLRRVVIILAALVLLFISIGYGEKDAARARISFDQDFSKIETPDKKEVNGPTSLQVKKTFQDKIGE